MLNAPVIPILSQVAKTEKNLLYFQGGKCLKLFLTVCSIIALLSLAIFGLILRPTLLVHAAAASTSQPQASYVRMCPVVSGMMSCDAMMMQSPMATPGTMSPNTTGTPMGLSPATLQKAYNLPSARAGTGQTVAIVDAFDDPNAETDLATYRSQFGLAACTTANGCFKKVNETGGATPPTANASWGVEISLDLDMVSAACPNCHILLVEANTALPQDLATSVNTAASLGANEISNSYGGAETPAETQLAADYSHAGVIITASSGDAGFAAGAQMPAAFNTVVSVGGTTLTTSTATTRGFTETAWIGAGSGCSAFITKPTWQKDPGCPNRTIADVAAVADPNTGVSVFDSFQTTTSWIVVGGTSASSPLIASTYALAGNAKTTNAASSLYANTGDLNDVTSGSNGAGGTYLCMAGVGYDGPTGNGTPNGVGAF
jgi:subtilase family serine protease